jgi:hypothetical protein
MPLVHTEEVVPSQFDGKARSSVHSPAPDRILVAELTGTARHHARWRELAQDEQDVAATELRELASERVDLLAQVAGIVEGASEGELDEPLARRAAHLCRLAGSGGCESAGRSATTSTRPSSASPAPSSAGADCGTPHFVRSSKAQGIEVKDRGWVPAELVVRFKAAMET